MTNSNTNFPPGPWYVERSPMGVRVTHGELEEDGFLRDDVPGIGRVGELGDERALAIAHLIAAAPELYEALADCYVLALAWASTYAESHGLPMGEQAEPHATILKNSRAALRKAEGRS